MTKRFDKERETAMQFNPLIGPDNAATIVNVRVALTFVQEAVDALGFHDDVDDMGDTLSGLSSIVAVINAALSLST